MEDTQQYELSHHKPLRSKFLYRQFDDKCNRLAANRDQVVRHRFHNRRCINPDHLTIGDRRDNLYDEFDRRANGVDWGAF